MECQKKTFVVPLVTTERDLSLPETQMGQTSDSNMFTHTTPYHCLTSTIGKEGVLSSNPTEFKTL